MLKIGNIELRQPFIQSPLSGYSDRAMRVLARKFGCGLTFSGVMLAKSACHKPLFKKPQYIIKADEHPIGAQILGTEPIVMARAARTLRQVGYDIIGLNFACPAPKVLRRGRGGAMIDKPDEAIEIFRYVRDAVDCPVTAKIRIGTDMSRASEENFWHLCETLAAETIDAITIHGRTVRQVYRGKADWDIIARVKQKLSQTTVLGSGDLFEAGEIVEKLKQSRLDGIAIARGAVGNPWIYRQIIDALQGKNNSDIYKPSIREQGEIILSHFEMLKELYHAGKSVGYFRKFLTNYAKLHPETKKCRKELIAAKTESELKEVIKKWYTNYSYCL